MSAVDDKVDQAADHLQAFVDSARHEGGVKAKLAEAMEDDPDFIRRLKPSLIAARARGETPRADAHKSPSDTRAEPRPDPAPPARKPKPRPKSGGLSPWLVIGAAFALGLLAAKAIDWRGYAHPR